VYDLHSKYVSFNSWPAASGMQQLMVLQCIVLKDSGFQGFRKTHFESLTMCVLEVLLGFEFHWVIFCDLFSTCSVKHLFLV